MNDAAEDGHPEDVQIEPGCPVRDVIEIVLDSFAKRCVTAPAMDLGPSGDPRFDPVPGHVVRNRLAELLREYRPFGPWPNEAHITPQNIDQLWKLVEAGLA